MIFFKITLFSTKLYEFLNDSLHGVLKQRINQNLDAFIQVGCKNEQT